MSSALMGSEKSGAWELSWEKESFSFYFLPFLWGQTRAVRIGEVHERRHVSVTVKRRTEH